MWIDGADGAVCDRSRSRLPERCDDREYSSGWRRMIVASSAPAKQLRNGGGNRKEKKRTHITRQSIKSMQVMGSMGKWRTHTDELTFIWEV